MGRIDLSQRQIACLAAFIVGILAHVNTIADDTQPEPSDWNWQLPKGFSPPPVPASNPMSQAKVTLGRRLFYDNRLSINRRNHCGSCHEQQLAFTDGRAQALGTTGEQHARSSMSLVNVAYNQHYTWASRQLRTLEQQIRIPLFNDRPIELGMLGQEALLTQRLRSSPHYADQFQKAFPDESSPISIDNVVKALASFVRTIISANSPFDQRLFEDDETAMSATALRGMRLFYSNTLKCGTCHNGRGIAGDQHDLGKVLSGPAFHNTGLYNIASRNEYPGADSGLRMESQDAADDGKFRAPTLRNIALTAPYMHDGSIATLSAVLDHYAAGGQAAASGDPGISTGSNARKSALVTGFSLAESDRIALLAFLHSLTDATLLDDPRFQPLTECAPADGDLPALSATRC